MQQDLCKIIIASYLHDMGKLLWRGGMNREHKKYQVAHAEHVFDFFNKSNQTFSSFWKEIGLIASLHHAKDFYSYKNWKNEEQKQLAWIIYMADNISSKERVDERNLEEKKEYEHIKSFGLRPVFENIFQDKLTSKWGYIPKKLDDVDFEMTEKGVLTVENKFEQSLIKYVGDEAIESKFGKLAKDFVKELEQLALSYNDENLSGKEMKNLIYSLDILLQNYFSFVPSDAYNSIGDISLYDHTKTTVAIATALRENGVHLQENIFQSQTSEIEKEEISLIAGDFPSIQKYIFGNIQTSESLSKRLRAKSLTVQLLNEAVVEYLCSSLEISRASVLMNAGGKFVILAGKAQEQNIKTLEERINTFLIEKYEGNIKFTLVSQIKTLGELFEGDTIQDSFVDLFDVLSRKKFQNYSLDNVKQVFGKKHSVNGKVICKLCGLYYSEKDNESDEDIRCEYCDKEIELGEKIVKSECKGVYLSYQQGEDFDFMIDIEKRENESLFIQFNTWNAQNDGLTISKSLNLYVPKNKDGKTTTFEDLASKTKGYLCMLKGDIDMMGLLFKHGFNYNTDKGSSNEGNSIYSVSRIVQLSRMLELFFGKYLQNCLQYQFENVYTVFSGGDDFVFIVPFESRLKFIKALSKEFQKFVAENQKIHFSIGLSIFKDKTPFKQVDEQTEELLKVAKSNAKAEIIKKMKKTDSQSELDFLKVRGVCFYDRKFVFTPSEIEDYEEKLDLKRDFEEGGISDTMLYTLYLQISEMYELLEEEEINRAKYLHLGARIFYMLRKNVKEEKFEKINKDLKEMLLTLTDKEEKKKNLSELLCKITNKLFSAREEEK